ncbi:ABC transporter ATP-binding protein [Mesoaciditoga lauensis]|uniref:ABC transporter ATP-binding protein n=1 Tax=Mesoaciditoga lauensis TaxID=1495039 RepID=UPI000562DEEA|nr:ABC transporter ATP-binding protein [Mesoaciditoga lauensis]
MKALEVENLKASIGNFKVRDVSFFVQENEVLVILGDNGAGKTKILEMIAGFIPLESGKIKIFGRDVTSLAVQKRRIGFIFQDLGLFPHMTVEKNIEYGLKYSKMSKPLLNDIIEIFQLKHLLHRFPPTLSGGEKQKVALARTLVTDPLIVFLDEPTSALSAREKLRIDKEIKEILKKIRKPAIFVTHSESEASVVGDRIAVVENGRIAQIGKSEEIFYRPASKNIADLFGPSNILEGVVEENKDEILTVKVKEKEIVGVGNFQKGESVYIFVRPEDVILTKEKFESSARNVFNGKIQNIVKKGPIFEIMINVGFDILSLVTKGSLERLELKVGDEINVEFKATAVHILK